MRRWVEDWYWEVRYAWQRAIRGYDDRMVFEFCYEHARLVSNVLTHFQKNKNGHPVQVISIEAWQEVIGKMVDGFKAAITLGELGNDPVDDAKAQKKFDEGMKLFKKYYHNLWD